MARKQKWIAGVSADDHVADVAGRTLEIRLAVVEHYLPLAAHHSNESPENVHQLRVASRRAKAALELYKGYLPAKKSRRLSKQLGRIRRTAGDARDCDVLLARLEAASTPAAAKQGLDKILKRIRQHRRQAQPAIVAICEKLTAEERLHEHIDQLLARVRPRSAESMRKKNASFQDWAPQRLRPLITDFLGASPNVNHSLDDLHRFRISGKKLRYAMELLAPAFPDAFRSELYPSIEQIQARLGNVMDHLAAHERYTSLLEECSSEDQTKLIHKLIKSETQSIKDSKRKFFTWWTDDLKAKLMREFEAFMGDAPQS